MPPNPRDPVVLIRNTPLDRVDREVGERVRERIKRIRTGPHPAAAGGSRGEPAPAVSESGLPPPPDQKPAAQRA